MTGARERRCKLLAPAPRTLARPHVRMSSVPLGSSATAGATYAVTCTCTRRYVVSRNGRNARIFSACTHCSMYTPAAVVAYRATGERCSAGHRSLKKKGGKLVNHNLNPVSTCSIHSSASVESRPPPWSSMQQRLAVCCLLGIRVLRPLGHRREAPTRCQVMPP